MAKSETRLSGGCACGAVRYEATAEPLMMGCCHCRDCQRQTGSAYFPAVVVPTAALRVEGAPNSYVVKADNGNTVTRAFCGNCGSTLWASSSGMPESRTLSAASLDDPSRFAPGMHVFIASAQPWDVIPAGVPRFERMPEAPR
jgi:hypothetical protein